MRPPAEAGIVQIPPTDLVIPESSPTVTRRGLLLPHAAAIFTAACGNANAASPGRREPVRLPAAPTVSSNSGIVDRVIVTPTQLVQAGAEPTPQPGMRRFTGGPIHIDIPSDWNASPGHSYENRPSIALWGAIGDEFDRPPVQGKQSNFVVTTVEDAKGKTTNQYGQEIAREVARLYPQQFIWNNVPNDAPSAAIVKGERVFRLFSNPQQGHQIEAYYFVKDGKGIRLVMLYDQADGAFAKETFAKMAGSITFDFTRIEPTPQPGMKRFTDGPVHLDVPVDWRTRTKQSVTNPLEVALRGREVDLFSPLWTQGKFNAAIFVSTEDVSGKTTNQYGQEIATEVTKLYPPQHRWQNIPDNVPSAATIGRKKAFSFLGVEPGVRNIEARFLIKDGKGIRLVAIYDPADNITIKDIFAKMAGSATLGPKR